MQSKNALTMLECTFESTITLDSYSDHPPPRSHRDALYHIPSDEEFCWLAKPAFQQRTWENMGINDWIVFMFFPRNWPTWDDLCPYFRILLQLTGKWDRMDNKWWQFCLSLISIGRLDWNKQIPAGSFKFYKIKISLKHFAIWDPCSRECNANAFVWNSLFIGSGGFVW